MLAVMDEHRLRGSGRRVADSESPRGRVAVLDGIMSIALKNSPGLLAEWKAAKPVQRRLPAEQTAPAPGSGSAPVSGT